MRRKCLGFLALVFVLVMSMFSNVFASNDGWTCMSSYNTNYSKGDVIKSISNIEQIVSTIDSSSELIFESNFEVKSGDELYVCLETSLQGNEEYIYEASSHNVISVTAENGTTLCSVSCNLGEIQIGPNGLYNLTHFFGNDEITITDETAGKLTVEIFIEGPGTEHLDAVTEAVCLEINGSEV